MKRVFVLYILLSANIIWANNDVETLRKNFVIATQDEKKAKELYLYFSTKENISEPLQMAYKGATIALIAKYSNNPYTKLKYVNSALDLIDEAINKSPENFEIRYLRFSIERNLPSIIFSTNNIEKDIEVVCSYLTLKQDWDSFEAAIAKDLLSSKYLSKNQYNQLNKKFNSISNA
jgi:hypothetical protein